MEGAGTDVFQLAGIPQKFWQSIHVLECSAAYGSHQVESSLKWKWRAQMICSWLPHSSFLLRNSSKILAIGFQDFQIPQEF
jgi:hypothetical protein